jgi:Bax protein
LPVSLVLAQAANESGWGTSRFAIDGNNFFGVWCYVEGCGLKPLDRDQGARHEVKRFESIYEGVAAYIHNINTNPAYSDLRAIRMSMRSLNVPARGVQLAEGLLAYSIRGKDYVRDIQAMIRSNRLEQITMAEQV